MTAAEARLDLVLAVTDPGAAAELAAEALRMVNRLTLGPPTPGTSGWEEIGDLHRVLGDLRVLVDRLPQALGQLARHLHLPADGVYYRSDSGTCESPETLFAMVATALRAAQIDAFGIGSELEIAQAAVSHLYT